MTAMPTRIETDLYDAAKSAAAVMSRSTAQQINHWARIGRELEAGQGISAHDIAAVLAGRTSYDSLNSREQAVIRAEWEERIAEVQENLNLEDEFIAGAVSWVEADSEGQTIVRDPGARPERRIRPRSR